MSIRRAALKSFQIIYARSVTMESVMNFENPNMVANAALKKKLTKDENSYQQGQPIDSCHIKGQLNNRVGEKT